MSPIVSVLLLCLLASVNAAPAESEATTAGSVAATPTTAASTSEAAKATADPSQTSSPATPDDGSTTAGSLTVGALQDTHQLNNASGFTCNEREIGYYADVDRDCKVYHFCAPGEYNGDKIYQRISYLCLNETVFDQQAFDCVQSANMTAPCKDSTQFYEASNKVLRMSLLGVESPQQTTESNKSDISTTTAPASS